MLIRFAINNAAHHTEQSRNCHQCDNLGSNYMVCDPVLPLKIDCFCMLQPVANVTDRPIDNCQDCPL